MAPSSSNMRCTAPPVQQHDRAGLRRAQVLKQALGGGAAGVFGERAEVTARAHGKAHRATSCGCKLYATCARLAWRRLNVCMRRRGARPPPPRTHLVVQRARGRVVVAVRRHAQPRHAKHAVVVAPRRGGQQDLAAGLGAKGLGRGRCGAAGSGQRRKGRAGDRPTSAWAWRRVERRWPRPQRVRARLVVARQEGAAHSQRARAAQRLHDRGAPLREARRAGAVRQLSTERAELGQAADGEVLLGGGGREGRGGEGTVCGCVGVDACVSGCRGAVCALVYSLLGSGAAGCAGAT